MIQNVRDIFRKLKKSVQINIGNSIGFVIELRLNRFMFFLFEKLIKIGFPNVVFVFYSLYVHQVFENLILYTIFDLTFTRLSII